MKARLAPSFEKKIMSLDCLTVMVFSQNHCLQKVFKMITAAACEGPGRCVRQLNKILFPVFPHFQSCSRQIVSPAEKLTVLQLIGLDKYENVRKA